MSDNQPPTLGRVLCPALNLNPPNTAPQLHESAYQYFTSVPWCADLLLNETGPDGHGTGKAISYIPQCFNPESPLHDQFVGATLATPRGLKHMLSFFRVDDSEHLRDPSRPIKRVDSLFALGDGVCGYHNVGHGGMTMTMVDEAMGTVNELNTVLGKDGPVHHTYSVTATLEIKFLQPVTVPGVVWITSWAEEIEGRKTRMRCEVKDGKGVLLAKCASIWVAVKPNL